MLAGIAGCADRNRPQVMEPSFDRASFQDTTRGRALERFPEMLEFLPAVRVVTPENPLPPELTDAELMEAVARAGGKVIIGLKPALSARTREAGVVPAIDRATALAARAAVQALGAELTMSYRHSSAVAATIRPELAPALRALPVVDYVEPAFPGILHGAASLVQAPPPQDTSWGVKRVLAHHAWSGLYGLSTRGEWTFVTILDRGVDSVHRWAPDGDGPENMYLDCYWIEGSGSSCYDDNLSVDLRGHGAHVGGIIASRDNEYGYIGIAHNPQRFASIKVCQADGNCRAEFVADGLDWVLGQSHLRRILNISIGYCEDFFWVRQMVASLETAGVLVIASAGNHTQGISLATACPWGQANHLPDWATSVMYPARYSSVMAVSGTLSDDAFAAAPPPGGGGNGDDGGGGCGDGGDVCGVPGWCSSGSRYGPEVEIAAPFWARSMWGNGGYQQACGTSMSAPVVAAVAALVWSRNPGWTGGQVRQHLKNTAVAYSPASQFGSGRVNAFHALYGTPAPPPPLEGYISGPITITIKGTYTWTANPSGGTGAYAYQWSVYWVSLGQTYELGTGQTQQRTVYAGDGDFEMRVTIFSGAQVINQSRMVYECIGGGSCELPE